jgi:hypothetical protein
MSSRRRLPPQRPSSSASPTPPQPAAAAESVSGGSLAMVLLLGLLAHGLVLLTDHVIWDGWWANADLGLPDAGILARQFRESGKPLEGWFLVPFRLIAAPEGRIAAGKLAGVACWIGSFLAMHACLRRLARLEAPVALAITALAVAAPVYEVLGDVSLAMYPACMLLFWCGWLLFAMAIDRRGGAAVACRVAAAALLFLSFNVNSLLVMHYAVAATFAVLRLRGVPRADLRGRLVGAALRYPEILALPVAFWIWKAVFTPTSGFYAAYNKPSFAPAKLALGYAGVVRDLIAPMSRRLVSSPLWLLAAIAAGAGLWWRLSARDAKQTPAAATAPPAHGWRLVACGLVLLAAAAFPYITVGQAIMAHGWWSRSCVLFPLPIAMTVVGLLVAANRSLAATRPFAWLAAAAAIAVLFIGACWRNTLTMQAYGAKQAAIRRDLRELIDARSPAVIQLRDYFPIRYTNDFYPIAVWTFLAAPPDGLPTTFVLETGGSVPGRTSVGDERTIGADGQPTFTMGRLPISGAELERLIETETGMPYAMTSIRRTGPHLLVGIGPAPNVGDDGPTIGAEYLRRRWFAPGTLNDYVTSLTQARVESLPPIE